MRALTVCAILVGGIGHLTAFAQAPGTQAAESDVDFSGTYVRGGPVDLPAYTEPDVYPFTEEGERNYRDYVDPRRVDDCSVPSFPQFLLLGYPMRIDQEDGRIVLLSESGNTTRIIHMDGASPPAGTSLFRKWLFHRALGGNGAQDRDDPPTRGTGYESGLSDEP